MSEMISDPQGLITIQIREDGAWMTMLNGSQLVSEETIINMLDEAGIIEGYDRARVYMNEKGAERNFGEPFPVALNQMPSEPQVEFSLLFNLENCIDPEHFNLSELEGLQTADIGTPLAHLFVTRSGRPGQSIFGEPILPTMDDEDILESKIGENVEYNADQSHIQATAPGYPYVDDDGRVCVKSDFIVEGDIDLNQENFYLHGNLIVFGNIQDKINIELSGDLQANGDVIDSSIRAKGNIKINGDILNCQKIGVVSEGSIEFDTAENAFLMAKDRIKFKEHANFCKLISEKGIKGDPETSSIVGGMVHSGSDVEVAVLGSTGAIGTDVEITISPFIKERMLQLTKKMTALKMDELENAEEILRVTGELEDLENKLEEEINQTLLSEETKPKHIVAYKKVFPGTYVRILKKSRTITEEYDKISFSLVDGELIMESYVVD